jgi:hypothetical protein
MGISVFMPVHLLWIVAEALRIVHVPISRQTAID